jgi:hypothetical protein
MATFPASAIREYALAHDELGSASGGTNFSASS